jgi:hypothetical protein
MKRLRDSDSTSKHRRQVRFHMARCKGEGPLHDKLHAEASLVYAALRAAARDCEDAEDAAVAASGVADRAEEQVEDVLRDIRAEASQLDRANMGLMAERTIFPKGLTPEIKPIGAAQLDVLTALRVRLAPYAKEEGMSEVVGRLDKAEAGLRAALDAETAANAEVERCFAIEREARRAVREQLASAHARLLDLYRAQPILAERFFLRAKASASKKETDAAGS